MIDRFDRTARRSLLWHGLGLTLRRPGAVVWTYAANLGVALLFAVRMHAQLDSLLSHSLAGQRLTTAFDLGVLNAALLRTTQNAPSSGVSSYLGPGVYFCLYFLLVPGALFTYHVAAPGRLAILLSDGARFFWRFVRVTLLTLALGAAVMVPLFLLQVWWSDHIDERMVGMPALLRQSAGWLVLGLVGALLRTYFDLVEVYTVHLDDQLLNTGFPDKRVRLTLFPALRTLRRSPRLYGVFLLLLVLGAAGFLLPAISAMHRLAQPRVWPMFLLAQLGLLLLLLTRFWQRAAVTVLAHDNPLPVRRLEEVMQPPPYVAPHDAIPDPEPEVPSLDEPDPGVFHPDAPMPTKVQ